MPTEQRQGSMRQEVEILIVEDSPTQAAHLQYLLERNNFKVSSAKNGKEALVHLARSHPQLIISDVVMPEMGGYELCHAVKSNPDLENIPLILVTSLADVQDVLQGLESGADNFIRKPYDEKYLLSRIDYLLMNRSIRQNQKMQMGMEIYLLGKKHFVTAERQQILDLLISTYEEAIRVKEDLEARQQELTLAALYEHTHGEVLRLFNATFDRAEILRGMLDILARNHPFPVSAIYSFDDWSGMYKEEVSHTSPAALHIELSIDKSIVAEAARENRATVLHDHEDHTRMLQSSAELPFRPACIFICPVKYQEKRLAVLVIVSGREFNDRDQTFVERLAAQLGVALQNIRQYDDLRLLAEQLRLRSEEITAKNLQLEEANRMKSEFLANMSHELRTPLNAIIGFSEVMRDGLVGELSAQQREYIADIFESGKHLLSLINDVLDLSKIEAGKMALEGEFTEVSALLQNSLSIVKERASTHRIKLKTDIADELGHAWLDPRKVKQILYNLLSNAIKFTPENGTVTLRATLTDRQTILARKEERPEMHTPLPVSTVPLLEISVSDTGIGISAADMARLFQPFVQLDSSLSRRFEGTGLGLVMIKKLTDLHGGAVSVASLQGNGSTFTIWLPYRNDPGADARSEPALGNARENPLINSASPLVLVIEDEADAADLIQLQLEHDGCRVVCVPSAEEALIMLSKDPRPDLITLDILLPGLDGWDFLSRIKTDANLAHIPVVIVSIVADSNKGISLGAAQVLQKPISISDLEQALASIGFMHHKSSITVLVVDDDPMAVEIVSTHLNFIGCNVLRAYSGAEGLQIAKTRHPDLIILDLVMPGINGFEVVEELKTERETASIPIIVLSSKHLTVEDLKTLNGQVLQVMEKSKFNHGSFISEVHRALGKKWPTS